MGNYFSTYNNETIQQLKTRLAILEKEMLTLQPLQIIPPPNLKINDNTNKTLISKKRPNLHHELIKKIKERRKYIEEEE